MLRANRLKEIIDSGHTALGCSLNEARDPGTIHCLAAAGLDFVFIDLEHNSFNPETVFDLVAHSKAAGITAMVRPPAVEYSWITRLLDAGCQALLLPNLRHPEEVAALLRMARYHPCGERGVALVGGANSDYRKVPDARALMEAANQQLLVGIVIETREAVEQLPEMLQPGVDLAVVGYGDLAQSFGLPGEGQHPRVLDTDQRLHEECRARGIAYGVFEPVVERLPDVMARQPGLIVHGGVFQFLRSGVERARVQIPRADQIESAGDR